jgi:hypothetical protein
MRHLLLVLAGVALLAGSLGLLAWAGQQDPRLDEADCVGAVLDGRRLYFPPSDD